MDAVATQDAERVAALYTEDARFMMPGWPPIVGRSEILNFFKAALQGVINRVLLDTTEIEVSGDLAFGTGGNRISLSPPGEVPREEMGKYVTVYRRIPSDGWKIVVDSYSNNE